MGKVQGPGAWRWDYNPFQWGAGTEVGRYAWGWSCSVLQREPNHKVLPCILSVYSSVFDNLIISVFVSSHMNKVGLASYNLNLHCAWSIFVQSLKSLGSSPSRSEVCYLNHKYGEFWYLSRFPWWLVGFMLQCTAKDNQNRIYSYQPHLFLHCRPWWGKCQYLCRYFNFQFTVSMLDSCLEKSRKWS